MNKPRILQAVRRTLYMTGHQGRQQKGTMMERNQEHNTGPNVRDQAADTGNADALDDLAAPSDVADNIAGGKKKGGSAEAMSK
jgi:hypothetical protein